MKYIKTPKSPNNVSNILAIIVSIILTVLLILDFYINSKESNYIELSRKISTSQETTNNILIAISDKVLLLDQPGPKAFENQMESKASNSLSEISPISLWIGITLRSAPVEKVNIELINELLNFHSPEEVNQITLKKYESNPYDLLLKKIQPLFNYLKEEIQKSKNSDEYKSDVKKILLLDENLKHILLHEKISHIILPVLSKNYGIFELLVKESISIRNHQKQQLDILFLIRKILLAASSLLSLYIVINKSK